MIIYFVAILCPLCFIGVILMLITCLPDDINSGSEKPIDKAESIKKRKFKEEIIEYPENDIISFENPVNKDELTSFITKYKFEIKCILGYQDLFNLTNWEQYRETSSKESPLGLISYTIGISTTEINRFIIFYEAKIKIYQGEIDRLENIQKIANDTINELLFKEAKVN